MENNQLYHWGIKGQKWGVRRYQNKDGTLTSAGKKRRRADYEAEAKGMSDQELRSKIDRMNLEKRYANLSRGQGSKAGRAFDATGKTASIGAEAGKVAKDGYKMMDLDDTKIKIGGQGMSVVAKTAAGAKKITNVVENKRAAKQTKSKLETMSDDDLRKTVNRMDLEQQYSSLKKENVNRGKMSASDTLEVVGSVVSIAASATAMAVAIHSLKKGKS